MEILSNIPIQLAIGLAALAVAGVVYTTPATASAARPIASCMGMLDKISIESDPPRSRCR